MASPYPVLDDISHIAGNAPDNVKRLVGDPKTFFTGGSSGHPIFGEAIQRRLSAIEMSINKKAEEPKKTEARYVMEIEVAEGM